MTREQKRDILAALYQRINAHAQWHYVQGRLETAPTLDAIAPCAQPWACPGRV